jgi:hypothetical protein
MLAIAPYVVEELYEVFDFCSGSWYTMSMTSTKKQSKAAPMQANPTEPAVYGSYSLFPMKYTFVILRQDFDHHKRTVAFVDSPAQWDRFVAALEAGDDEVASVRAVS